MLSSIIGLIICLVVLFVFAYLLDVLRLRRLIKDYNKRHPHDLKDVKKTTPWSINKQLIDWQISEFAKRSDGYSVWEKFQEWEASRDEDETI